jgi:ribosomal protein S18 acetylase RimI-like enzyme
MNPALIYRLATADDALCIGALGTQVWLDTYATDGIRPALAQEVLDHFSPAAVGATLSQPDVSVIIAERLGHLVGFAQIRNSVDDSRISGHLSAELERLYVQERFAGKGIGWQLLTRAEDLAREQGASALWLTVWVGNTRALAFYPRQLYEDGGVSSYCFNNEIHENRLFFKRLAR